MDTLPGRRENKFLIKKSVNNQCHGLNAMVDSIDWILVYDAVSTYSDTICIFIRLYEYLLSYHKRDSFYFILIRVYVVGLY
jgi:hypothetical protein